MPFDLDRFCESRPFLFHLTAARNAERILGMGRIDSTAVLLKAAGVEEFARSPRRGHRRIVVDGFEIWIRDQDPLYSGNTLLEDGCSFEEFLQLLDRRVFFWPGKRSGQPISSGLNHFGRYREEDCRVLRVPTRALFAANPGGVPTFCKYNSGAPRCFKGHGSPRGHNTFLPASTFPFKICDVVEVTFEGSVRLPVEEVNLSSHRDWVPAEERASDELPYRALTNSVLNS